jgi:hypothetical protein
MKTACIKAYHEMEERYARLVLEYHSNDQRNLICDTVGEVIDELGIAPALTITPGKNLGGEYDIEFHDDYDRESFRFFETLIKKLGVDHCEVEG